jgi:sugar lactone lactonase YvrE
MFQTQKSIFYNIKKIQTMSSTPKFIRMLLAVGLALSVMILGCQQEEILLPEDENMEAAAFKKGPAFPDLIPLPTGFQPEGIVVGKGKDFYVGSIISGAIFKGDLQTGAGAYLVQPQVGGSAVGLSYDNRSKYLFVAGGFYGKAFVYNSNSGVLVATFQFTNPLAVPTMINDVVVTQDAVYFTDLLRPYFYKVPLGPAGSLPDPLAFQEIPLGGDFVMAPPTPTGPSFNANGIDATPNGQHLVLVNTSLGTLYRVDPVSGQADLIDLGGATLPFGDGILLDGKTLYVVQNFFNQIAEVKLSPDLLTGVVESNILSPNFRIPATIGEFGNSLYAVNARFDVASPFTPAPDVEFEVVRVDKP